MYEDLLVTGKSAEQALDEMGITRDCSRTAMANPIFVFYNMENRAAIEGLISVERAEQGYLPKFDREGKQIITFPVCHDIAADLPSAKDEINIYQGQGYLEHDLGVETEFGDFVGERDFEGEEEEEYEPMGFEEGLELDEFIAGAIKEKPKDTQEFVWPEIPGIPLFNASSFIPEQIKAGAGLHATVMTGRTYLAR